VRVSITITDYSWPGGPAALAGQLVDVARAADDAGLDTVWVADHLLQADPNSTPDAAMLEAYGVLGYLAGRTERVRLGTMVTAATYRAPALLVKAVTTLDVLSGGRAWLGVGAGYQQDEARAMGLPLPPVPERFDRLEDLLRLAKQMWAGDASPFTGTHARLERPVGNPLPVTRPHPPILVGGTGERRTLPLVAKYADAANLFDIPDGGVTVRRKLDVLAGLCAEIGRPYGEIERTLSTRVTPGEPPAALARRAEDLGIDHLVVLAAGPWTPAAVTTLAAAV
jgi:F420-dependent oxidoreductase-like protein